MKVYILGPIFFLAFAIKVYTVGPVLNSTLVPINSSSQKTTEAEISKRALRDAKSMMSKFASNLKSYIQDIDFECERFSKEAPRLQKSLSKLSRVVKSLKTEKTRLSAQLKYATKLYETMIHSAIMLEENYPNEKANNLVKKLVHLKVAILALPIQKSLHDAETISYVSNILAHGLILYRWKAYFETLENVPIGLRSVFNGQFRRANHTFCLLLQTVPQSIKSFTRI